MKTRGSRAQRRTVLALAVALAAGFMEVSCTRLPYTTQTVHEDEQVVVKFQRELEPAAYTQPVQLTSGEIASVLRGFSVREQQRLPLRWFAEEAPPTSLLREDEVQRLAPYLSEAMQKVGPNERVHFEVRMPGSNPKYDRDIVAGWVAVRDPLLYLTVEHFRTHIPIRTSDLYDRNYPTTPPPPRDYILYFEPGRFWTTDDKGRHAVEFRQFLRSGEAGPTRAPQPPPAATP
ncbi:MAG TPA: hypothetical protein VJ805_04685 [Nitrospiraceae bacterium]|nr:hypothetical protein [Nitrospiraceae bacterium]